MLADTDVIDTVDADRIFTSNRATVATLASATERTPDADEVAAEASEAPNEIANLLDDEAVSQRLRPAIDAPDARTE